MLKEERGYWDCLCFHFYSVSVDVMEPVNQSITAFSSSSSSSSASSSSFPAWRRLAVRVLRRLGGGAFGSSALGLDETDGALLHSPRRPGAGA